MQSERDEIKDRFQSYENDKEIQAFLQLLEATEKGWTNLLDPLSTKWLISTRSPPTLMKYYANLCFGKNTHTYEPVRARGLLKLPRHSTLQNYVEHSTGEVGVTYIIKECLRVEHKELCVEQKDYCSLIIDEMAIAQKVTHERQVDKIFGLVDTGPGEEESPIPEAANRLLCFVLRDLSTAYVTTVGYFFTRCLKNGKLFSTTIEILKSVEDVGLLAMRIVTDNHHTNTPLFKRLSEAGTLARAAPQPSRKGGPLSLSFDPNHLIKNLRTNFPERETMDGDEQIVNRTTKERSTSSCY